MRILVFCGTRDAIEKFDMVEGWRVAVAIYPPEQRRHLLEWFKETPDACLAVDRSFIHGWRAPDDTRILFDPSWPFGPGTPEWKQAVARRAIIPQGPDEADALAYMAAGTPTGRTRSEPEMQNLPGTLADKIARLAQSYSFGPTEFSRRVGVSPLLGMPYGNPRRMAAEDLTWTGGPAFSALIELERRDMERKLDFYLEMYRAMELAKLQPPLAVFLGMDLAKDEPEPDKCNCLGGGLNVRVHSKSCPLHIEEPDEPGKDV